MQGRNTSFDSVDNFTSGYQAPNLQLRHTHIVRYALLSWPRLTSTLRMVYLAIAAYADETGYAEPTLAEICDLAEVGSHNTVVACARELEKLERLLIIHRYGDDGAKLSNGYQLVGDDEGWHPRPKNPPEPQPLTVAHRLVAQERERDEAAGRERELLQRIAELEPENARLRGQENIPSSPSDVGGGVEGPGYGHQSSETAWNQSADLPSETVSRLPSSLSDYGGMEADSTGVRSTIPVGDGSQLTEGGQEGWTDRVVRENWPRLSKEHRLGGSWEKMDQARRHYRIHEDELRELVTDWDVLDRLKEGQKSAENSTAQNDSPSEDRRTSSDVAHSDVTQCPYCRDPYPVFNGLGMCALCSDDPERRRLT